MSIGFWQVVIVLGVIVYIIVRNIKNRPKDSSKNRFGTKLEKRMMKLSSQKEEKVSASEQDGGGLTDDIARLKKLYKNGTLTKAEFEKAKNKLLK